MSSSDARSLRLSKPVMVILVVLVIAALAYLLVIMANQNAGVNEIEQAQATVPPSEPALGTESSEVAGGETGTTEKPVTPEEPAFEVFSARDPFDQLVVDSTAPGVADTTDTGATVPSDTTTQTPIGGTDPSGSTPAPGGGQTTVGTTTIALEDVFAEDGVDKVNLVINGEGYEAAEDQTVADVTVLDIEGSCATMRYEDTRFILCEGEHVQK